MDVEEWSPPGVKMPRRLFRLELVDFAYSRCMSSRSLLGFAGFLTYRSL